ncbi:uncharacterized protein BDR25DRAFT_37395 [Lindgomyces ingoldianus]|uniref:Uncharacterized protein n=1 Tax=Lindgomyces ingoldianus TaxID=673940 RepID=A0ACB6QV67_9PLEO|nr:uncharacterized protein BDR25DRAFT_37395 [Lindgomyces ingoldianus]KAF2470157.1 hypothetical protein BDR25DRAFT_37395 [Lindgomyces ingoldianus]
MSHPAPPVLAPPPNPPLKLPLLWILATLVPCLIAGSATLFSDRHMKLIPGSSVLGAKHLNC